MLLWAVILTIMWWCTLRFILLWWSSLETRMYYDSFFILTLSISPRSSNRSSSLDALFNFWRFASLVVDSPTISPRMSSDWKSSHSSQSTRCCISFALLIEYLNTKIKCIIAIYIEFVAHSVQESNASDNIFGWMQLYRICLSKKTNIRQECKKYKENKCKQRIKEERIQQGVKEIVQKNKGSCWKLSKYTCCCCCWYYFILAQLDDNDHPIHIVDYRQMRTRWNRLVMPIDVQGRHGRVDFSMFKRTRKQYNK